MDDSNFTNPSQTFNSGNTFATRSNTLFSIYSSLGLTLFCLAKHLWGASQYFIPSAILIISSIIIWMCYLSFSARFTSNSLIWNYLSNCSNVSVILNFAEIFLCAHWLSLNSHADILLLNLLLIIHIYVYFHMFKKYFPSYHTSIINKICNWCKLNTALVIIIAFTIATTIVWYYCPKESAFADLTLNLLAGFISSIITIAVIEKIIQRQKERNEKPLKEALYRDVQLFTTRLIGIWSEMYAQSTAERENIPVAALFTAECITKIYHTLDLEGITNTVDKQNWFTYLYNGSKDLVDRGRKICTDYFAIADPELIHTVHYLITDSVFLGLFHLIAEGYAADIQLHIPRPTLLQCYLPEPVSNDYDAVIQLLAWCHHQYDVLHDDSDQRKFILPILTNINILNPHVPPSSIMSESKLEKMISAFDKYQNHSQK